MTALFTLVSCKLGVLGMTLNCIQPSDVQDDASDSEMTYWCGISMYRG